MGGMEQHQMSMSEVRSGASGGQAAGAVAVAREVEPARQIELLRTMQRSHVCGVLVVVVLPATCCAGQRLTASGRPEQIAGGVSCLPRLWNG